ncbi:Aminopeptidase 2 mitochondrial [Malassezia yamatoensis]|uniref:Aminopeptidase n=1 Tax=Malassezia yamatoensis TaxID=253288 RepID=A0AAJ5YXI7_9BASI|nr:Aminopeptidase 2 mitochondrial [Malassezia yamatoensis]
MRLPTGAEPTSFSFISVIVYFVTLILQRISSPFSSQSLASMSSSVDESKWFRLPSDVRPTHYDLTILSDLDQCRFQGVVKVALEVERGTKQITFNAGKGLELSDVLVSFEQNNERVSVSQDKEHERATVTLSKDLRPGSSLNLTAGFRGVIDDSMMGFYRSSWEHEGRKGNYALTQFEPTSARRAFPCWDEPELKAEISMRMVHRDDTVALGNMNVKEEHAVDKQGIERALEIDELHFLSPDLGQSAWKLTEFATTPKISTYLVAWGNGEFKYIEGSYTSPLTQRKVPMRVYTTPEFIHQARFALEVKEKILPVYEKVFDVEYPLPKLDTLVAADFDAGAMENWGLITGRTSIFLYEKKSGLAGKKTTAAVQSHEVAHMWFGDIATMAWWDNLWLNEAFATLMGEVIILDRVFPEWKSASQFINDHLNRALELDAKRSSHPVEIPLKGDDVEHAINQVFDAISYSKGASVLRMLSKLIGEETFLKGVSIYLKKHLYGNTKTRDLWDGISQASGRDIDAIMSSWVLKQGFPVLSVSEDDQKITVRQNRFLSTGDPTSEEDQTLWHVPLAIKKVENGKASVDYALTLEAEREKQIDYPNAKDAVWKLNADTMGVYRVAYTPERLALLGKVAAQTDSPFTVEDRVGLVSDAWMLAKANYTKTSSALTLTKLLGAEEKSSLVNQAMAQNLASVASVWWEQPKEIRDAINAFRASIYGPLAKELTLEFGEDDSVDLRELRTTAVGAAAAAGDEWTLNEIAKRFAPLRDHGDDSKIHPDLLRIVLSQSVRHGGEPEYEAALNMYKKPDTPAHKTSAMYALGSTRDPKLIQRTLDFVFSDQVKTQDIMYFFVSLSSNTDARRDLLRRFQKDFDHLVGRFEGNFSLANLIRYSLSVFTSESDAQQIESFFEKHDKSKFSMSLAQSLDSIRAQAKWLEADKEDVQKWLQNSGFGKA